MLYKNKTPYGARIIDVTSRTPEKEGKISSEDRINYLTYEKQERYMYAHQLESDYEPIGEGCLCPHCGTLLIDVKADNIIF